MWKIWYCKFWLFRTNWNPILNQIIIFQAKFPFSFYNFCETHKHVQQSIKVLFRFPQFYLFILCIQHRSQGLIVIFGNGSGCHLSGFTSINPLFFNILFYLIFPIFVQAISKTIKRNCLERHLMIRMSLLIGFLLSFNGVPCLYRSRKNSYFVFFKQSTWTFACFNS